MRRCVAFLDALEALPPDDWRRRAAAAHYDRKEARREIRTELERRCDAFELWALRDEVDALCWRLDAHERGMLREAISDAALAILADGCEQEPVASEMLAAFADLVPERRSLASGVRER